MENKKHYTEEEKEKLLISVVGDNDARVLATILDAMPSIMLQDLSRIISYISKGKN